MKKYINTLLIFCTLAFLGISCSDDDTLTTIAKAEFSSPIEASSGTIVINAENKYQSVLTVSWEGVKFPVNAPVTYSLQFDIPTDTIGSAAWAHATTIAVGEDVLSKSFLGTELNTMALNFGIPQDVAGQLVVRAIATLDRTVYSPSIVITVTPFVQIITTTEIYMPGAYENWDPAAAAKLTAIDSGVFQGYITFPAGSLEFNFTTDTSGNQFYGPDGNGGLAEGANGNFAVPAAGSYQITVNLNNLSYTAVPYSFGVVGTATAGGWDVDTDMTYDYVADQWTFTGPLVPGALKFRLNDVWTINYGSANGESGNIADGTVLLDNQGAHTIIEGGTYTVTFKVNTDPATATYSVTKID